MNDKIKVLFLDIDNTLLDFDAAAAWAMEQCFQKAGLEYKSEMLLLLQRKIIRSGSVSNAKN